MIETVRICESGKITLPAKLRQQYSIQDGDIFNLVDLDGMFAFVRMTPKVTELAREIEHLRLEAGVSMNELMQGWRAQREQYNRENYGE